VSLASAALTPTGPAHQNALHKRSLKLCSLRAPAPAGVPSLTVAPRVSLSCGECQQPPTPTPAPRLTPTPTCVACPVLRTTRRLLHPPTPHARKARLQGWSDRPSSGCGRRLGEPVLQCRQRHWRWLPFHCGRTLAVLFVPKLCTLSRNENADLEFKGVPSDPSRLPRTCCAQARVFLEQRPLPACWTSSQNFECTSLFESVVPEGTPACQPGSASHVFQPEKSDLTR